MGLASSAEIGWVIASRYNPASCQAFRGPILTRAHHAINASYQRPSGVLGRHQMGPLSSADERSNRVRADSGIHMRSLTLTSGNNNRNDVTSFAHAGTSTDVLRSEAPCFCCPVCGFPLLKNGSQTSLECAEGHNIAVAKEGHVNLLRTGRKARKGGKAGDEDGMVRARRAFFDRGHFSPVSAAIADLVVDGIQDTPSPKTSLAVLDAGCGEGTYIGHIHKRLEERGFSAQCFGIDISALAVRLAAKRHRGVSFAVGNCFSLPFQDNTFDCVVTAFSPWPPAEFKRVLKPGGFVVAAGPGPEHLNGLKAVLYGEPKDYQPRAFGSSTVGGAVDADSKNRPPEAEAEHQIQAVLRVSGDDASNLLQMTPYWWKARPEQQEGISSIEVLETPLDVLLSRHRYNKNP